MTGVPLPEYRRLKLFLLLDGSGGDVLTFILKSGTKPPTPRIDLDKYLNSLQKGKNKKNPFDKSQMKQIKNNPSWDNFDISLLYKAIRLVCEGIDDAKWKDQNELEGLITKIKDERNGCVHEKKVMTEKEFQDRFSEMECIFDKTLKEAKDRYNVPDNYFTSVRDKVLQDIRDMKKVLTVEEMLQRDVKDMLPLFMEQSKMHLQGRYEQAQYFDPLSFLTGSPLRSTHIQSIFCKTFLIDKTDLTKTAAKTGVRKTVDIDCFDLLTLAQIVGQTAQPSTSSQVAQSTQNKKPQFIMISGDAGSGKTTLLTFIMSEWIKDDHNCPIKHLREYDIILRILCREKNRPSLQDFLQQALPNIFVGIKERLVALLKECRVLFLIDGLDELSPSSSSDQLVTDILDEGKDVPGFTVICTSRPESVDDFLDNTPDSYQRWTMEMKGVSSIEERTDFVLRHYDSFPPHSSKDREQLKYLMECTGWRDHFRLPLNLLFVATVFYTDPGSIKNSNTETSLYINIHEWCVQKLQHRLPKHRHVGKDRLAREESIRKVLKVMYQVTLQGLLQDRLSLSKEDTDQLRNCCQAENLPSTEVMGAFLCLREDVVNQISHQTYFAPHKSLQEFFAAKYITSYLILGSAQRVKGIQRKLQHIVDRLHGRASGDIWRLLQGSSQKPQQLNKLKNLLLHVAGLLSQSDDPLRPRAMQEVVDLLVKIGMQRCNHWLSLLENTEVNSTILERAAEYMRSNSPDDENVRITDSIITSAEALFPLIPRKNVQIELQRREAVTSDLCRVTAGHICKMLSLLQHYKQPSIPPASDPVLCALPRRHLTLFAGNLSSDGIMLLQECQCLRNLRLAVSHDAPAILSALAAVCQSLPNLWNLSLHVPIKAVTPDVFTTPLPHIPDGDSHYSVTLVLSDVEENTLDQTCGIAAALQPSNGYWTIMFSGRTIKAAACKRLLNLLADAGVRILHNVEVPRTIIMTEQEENDLKNLVMTRRLCFFNRVPEHRLWKPW